VERWVLTIASLICASQGQSNPNPVVRSSRIIERHRAPFCDTCPLWQRCTSAAGEFVIFVTRRVKQTNPQQADLESVLLNSVEEEDKWHVLRNWGSGSDITTAGEHSTPSSHGALICSKPYLLL